jgi:hypothetical protein
MKRVISLLFSVCLVLALAGCIYVALDDSARTSKQAPPNNISIDEPSNINEPDDTKSQPDPTTSNIVVTGSANQKEYKVDDFTKVVVDGGASIVYKSSDSGKVVVDTQEDLFQYVRVSSDGETLTLDLTDKIWKTNTKVKITVYTPKLTEVTVNGAVQFVDSDTIKGKDFAFNVYGACDGDITMDVDSFKAMLAGTGNTVYHGSATTINADIAGAGNLDGLDLKTKEAKITINGAGSGSISCSDTLDVTINGLGNLDYAGDPVVNRTIFGLGKINKVNR